MSEIYFLAPSIAPSLGINWTAIGVWVSAIAALITMGALITTWYMSHSDKKYKKSQFFLDQINNYFSKAISILTECGNNNIKWHQAINALEEADKLKLLLTEVSHQSIYIANYIDIGYEIIYIIKKIDDFRFFYGVESYRDKSALELYQISKSPTLSLDWPNHKISTQLLLCLCKFVDKAGRASFDVNSNKTVPEKIFESDYFGKSLSNRDITRFTEIELKVIFEYIKDVEKNDKKA